jgi:hypothetical protein
MSEAYEAGLKVRREVPAAIHAIKVARAAYAGIGIEV